MFNLEINSFYNFEFFKMENTFNYICNIIIKIQVLNKIFINISNSFYIENRIVTALIFQRNIIVKDKDYIQKYAGETSITAT